MENGGSTTTPAPGPSFSMMFPAKKSGGFTKSKTAGVSKVDQRSSSGLIRTDSGRSNKSNKSLGTLSAFDPDSAATLSRETEVTMSMYEGDPLDDHTRRASASSLLIQSPDTQSKASSSSHTTTTTTTTKKEISSTGGGKTRVETTTTRYTTPTQNGGIHMNGDVDSDMRSSTKSSTSTSKQVFPAKGKKRMSQSETKLEGLSADSQDASESIISTLDSLLVDLDDHERSSFGADNDVMVTSSLDRKWSSPRSRNLETTTTTKTSTPIGGGGGKKGAFSIRSAFDDDNIPDANLTTSNTSLHDEKFKGDLSAKLMGSQEKFTFNSLPRDQAKSSSSTAFGKVISSGQDIANTLDRNHRMVNGGLTNGEKESAEALATEAERVSSSIATYTRSQASGSGAGVHETTRNQKDQSQSQNRTASARSSTTSHSVGK